MKTLLDLTSLVCFLSALVVVAIGAYPLAAGLMIASGIAALIEFVSF
jgi:intracellular septation protein A